MDGSHFTGPAAAHPLHRGADAHVVNVSVVRFQPGARNHWHFHSGGQVLHVVEGEGRVQSRGGEVRPIRLGDSVAAAPGEEHWHGAAAGGPMAHVAVTIGETRWLEPAAG